MALKLFEGNMKKQKKLNRVFSMDDFAILDDRVYKIETALSNIKQLINGNPEAVISLVELKKEFEFIEKTVNRVENSIKWFFGIIVTLSLGILGLAFSVLLSK